MPLVAVDYDPFSSQPTDKQPVGSPSVASGKLVPVDHNPFGDDLPSATTSVAPPTNMGFGERAQREADPTREQMQGAYQEQFRGQRERQGPVARQVDTFLGGLARGIPFAEDIGAAASHYIGGQGSSFQDAKDRVVAQGQVDVSDRPVTAIGGQVVGGLALPGGAAASATRAGNAGRGLVAGAGYGALYGAGQGDDVTQRVGNAATGAAVGGATGGMLGALLPRAQALNPALSPGQEVAQAAERIGVEAPRAVTTDSMALQRGAASLRNIPLAGNPLVKGAERAIGQMGQAADNVATEFGASSPAGAGNAVRDAITVGWKGRVQDTTDKLYKRVDDLIDPNSSTPLDATRGVVGKIMAERTASRISDPGKAVSFVMDAVKDAQGLTYEGVKGLRTRVGEMLEDPNALASSGVSQKELKRIYGSLTDDLRKTISAAGQPEALSAWERANRYASLTASRKENLQRIVNAPNDEGVVERLLGAASSKGRADITLLSQARKAAGPEAWDELAGTVVSRLGRDMEGQFSPQRFLTDYGKLSNEARAMLFGSTGRSGLMRSLNDLATVSSRFKDLQKFANPSGTAQNVAGGGLGAGLVAHPIAAIGTVVGGNIAARILAAPATASSAARWARAYETAVRKPTSGALASFQVASRNFGSTIANELGMPNPAQALFGALRGPVTGHADEEQPTR